MSLLYLQPRFALNFTTASLDSRVTFTRSGNTATFVNSSGFIAPINADLPRFDYDPVTLACKGLLIEEARTNLALYSEDFTNAFWTKGGTSSISATLIASPANTATANILVGADGTDRNGNVLLRTYTGLTSGASYTVSYYVIGQGGTTATLYIRDATTGAFGGTTLALTGSWQRITRTITLGASTTACNTYLGNTNGDIGVWGGQFELGAFATSYIPTTTTALTRNADVATITGTNFSDFWQATRGGASVLATPSTVSGVRPLVQFDDNTANEIIALRGNTTNPELYIVDGGAPQAQLDAGTIVANTPYSLTGWWQTNDCKARQNSGATVSDYTATIPTVTQARIGSDGTNYLNGTIATINYYDSFFGRPIYTRRKNKAVFSLL
jgi:hypothetical protein